MEEAQNTRKTIKPGSKYDSGAVSIISVVNVTGKVAFSLVKFYS